MRKARINVTQKDIDFGKVACKNRCPIARAVLRKFKTTTVDENAIYIERKKYKIPVRAKNFISQYDQYWKKHTVAYMEVVKPFSFTLNIRD